MVCIAGPTASGKTGFALDLARKLDGEIVNADALQVYADLSILSARPTPYEMADIPHHLFGHIDGDDAYSVGHWVREAVPIILDILARHKTPIITGGTGLYFKALLVGLADIPAVDAALMTELETWPIDRLRDEAERLDPVAARRILGDDPQRLQRLVGVAMQTGQALSDWQQKTRPIIPQQYARKAVLMPDRAVLYDRINRRFDDMIEAGGLDEARAVFARPHSGRSPMRKAIGLSHLLTYLRGECDLDRAVETAKRDSRRLAKRQSTWFRNQCPDWPQLSNTRDMAAFSASLCEDL